MSSKLRQSPVTTPIDNGVASLSQLNASSTLKARPATLHHAATYVDREDNHAPGSAMHRQKFLLTPRLRLDNHITSQLL